MRYYNRYRCSACKKIVTRESIKWWIKSYCTTTERTTRLLRLPYAH